MGSNSENQKFTAPFVAGFTLLDRFQMQWQQIHSKSIQIVSKAETASDKIQSIDNGICKMLKAIDDFKVSCKAFKTISDDIAKIGLDLKCLETNMRNIEDLLIILKSRKEAEEFNIFIDGLDSSFDKRTNELRDLSAKRKEKLKQDHDKRVEDFERKLEEELNERRRILEREFEEEKKRYLEKQGKHDQ